MTKFSLKLKKISIPFKTVKQKALINYFILFYLSKLILIPNG